MVALERKADLGDMLRGEAGQRMIVNGWGDGDYKDIMAGVDALVADGTADPDRLGVMGASYGGFMTSWLVGQTDRFRAAVAQNAVSEFGRALLGEPRWAWVGLPLSVARAFEYGFLVLGFIGSLLVSYRLAESEQRSARLKIFATWALISLVIWCAALWLMSQPMEMRGTVLGGG